jgi:DNA-binding MarR family transcriptional regulator
VTEPDDSSLQLEPYLPYQLAKLAKRVSDACNAEYGETLGVSIAEWRILAHLGQHEELPSRGLGKITFMDKSRISRALKSLEKKTYMARRPDPGDKRASFLSLTESGRELYDKIAPIALDWEARFLSVLDDRERRELVDILARLETQLDKMENIPTLSPPA